MIPVVIVHQNYKEYLKYNIKITSRNNKIILIGDKSIRRLENKNTKFYDINKYLKSDKVKKYSKYFTNYSSNERNYELFCFLRIIIIHLFMKENKIDRVFHLDSDNVLYYNINNYPFENEIAYQFGINDFEEDMCDSIHNGLINLNFCESFEKLFENIYINKETSLIDKKINYHKNNPGGICDMTFYFILRNKRMIQAQNLGKPINIKDKKYIFINNVNNGEGFNSRNQFETSGGFINIKKDKEKNLYVIDKKSKEKYYIFNTHFQGTSKKYLNQNLINNLNNEFDKILPDSYNPNIFIILTILFLLFFIVLKYNLLK